MVTPIGGLGDDVASDVVFYNNHICISVEQDILDPMPLRTTNRRGLHWTVPIKCLNSGRFGPYLHHRGNTEGRLLNRRFITTNVYPDYGGLINAN